MLLILQMQRSAAVSIGLTTPELLTNLEKRRQLSKKKISISQKSTESSSSEGDQSNDTAQTMDRKTSKSSRLKLHKPNISGAFLFKKTSVEKKSSLGSSQDNNKNEDSSLEENRRPSWERPWRNSWDATKCPLRDVNGEYVTKSTSTLNDVAQDRLFHHSLDAKWKSKSYKALPTTRANDSQTKEIHNDVQDHLNTKTQVNSHSLHKNIQPTKNEINPAALAEIAVSIKFFVFCFKFEVNLKLQQINITMQGNKI